MTIYFSWLTAPYGAFFMYSNLNPGLSASLEKSLKKFYPDFYVLKFKPRFERVSGKKFKKVLPRFLGFKLIGDI